MEYETKLSFGEWRGVFVGAKKATTLPGWLDHYRRSV